MAKTSDKKYISRCEKYHLKAGYVYVTKKPSIITTILGSCICICFYDTKKNYGGMNHYIFPKAKRKNPTTKFGDVSINVLYKTFIDMGSKPEDLVAQIAGGAYIENNYASIKASIENIKVFEEKIIDLKIKIIYKDIGGIAGRKVCFLTELNEIKITKIENINQINFINNNKFTKEHYEKD